MILVPVIDLLDGHAVQARQGLRAQYRPLQTPLCPHGDPLQLAHTLIDQWPFQQLYLADLNAIQGTGDHRQLIEQLSAAFPHIALWVDAGFRDPDDLASRCVHPGTRCVVGSETWNSTAPVPAACALSIDSDANGARDLSGICGDPSRMPDDLILMNLSRVGAQAGPDLALLAQWRQRCPSANLFAAGGVRHATDLQRLENAGAAGVLLASALHNGQLHPSDLAL